MKCFQYMNKQSNKSVQNEFINTILQIMEYDKNDSSWQQYFSEINQYQPSMH